MASLFDDRTKVVEFRPREADESAAIVARAEPSVCAHRQWVIDEAARAVKCRACGAPLDPIWCLLHLAEYHEQVDCQLAQIRKFREERAKRQQAAIERRQRAQARAPKGAQTTCKACDGTGWEPQGGGVVRCSCRITRGAAAGLIVSAHGLHTHLHTGVEIALVSNKSMGSH